jgi:hypothetical protein
MSGIDDVVNEILKKFVEENGKKFGDDDDDEVYAVYNDVLVHVYIDDGLKGKVSSYSKFDSDAGDKVKMIKELYSE